MSLCGVGVDAHVRLPRAMYELQIEFASLTDTFNQKLVHQKQKRCWKLATNVILPEEDVGMERE